MSKLSTLFTFFVSIYVILDRYASPIPKVTLAEVILCLFWGLFIIFSHKKIYIEKGIIIFCIYIFGYVLMPFTGMINAPLDMIDAVGTPARLLFIYFSIAILGKNLFDLKNGIKFIRWVAIVLALYACLQIIAAHFGIYLTTYIPYLPIMSDINIDESLLRKASYGIVFRPCSLLTEPAALSTYLLCALGLELFSYEHKYKYFNACLFSIICIISRSSTGIIVTFILWIIFFIKHRYKKTKQFEIGFVIAITVSIISLLLIYYFGIWEYFVARTFRESGFGDFSSSTRFYAINDMFIASDSFLGILFGQGLSAIDNYLPGFARSYLNMGLVGVLIILVMFFKIYIKSNSLQKGILILFIVLNIGTEIVLGPFALIFLCIAVSKCPLDITNGEIYVARK